MPKHFEKDDETFKADAYRVKGEGPIAWYVLGWETVPDEDTEWTGYEERTGRVVAVMVGDGERYAFDPESLIAIKREEYCGECGQMGCMADGLDRSEEEDEVEEGE